MGSVMKKCLVIDDSRVMRQVARKIYEALQYEVEEAQDCDSALGICRRQMPNEILLDLNLPGTNVSLFLVSLRRCPDGGKPHILLCATENDVDLLTEALHAGGDDYLLKPYDMKLIETKVHHQHSEADGAADEA